MKAIREYFAWIQAYGRAISEQRDKEYREFLMWRNIVKEL